MTRDEITEHANLWAHIRPSGLGNVGRALLDATVRVQSAESNTWVSLGDGNFKREIPPAE